MVVFNYMSTNQNAEVILLNDDKEFEFAEPNDDENSVENKPVEKRRQKRVVVKSNSGSSVSFMIRPLKVGFITIKVQASTPVAGDSIEKELKVEPEGKTYFVNKAIFLDLRNNPDFKTNLTINIPKNAIPDSTRIEASIIGDVLGPSIDNLDKLM
jgi:CD109 antigen